MDTNVTSKKGIVGAIVALVLFCSLLALLAVRSFTNVTGKAYVYEELPAALEAKWPLEGGSPHSIRLEFQQNDILKIAADGREFSGRLFLDRTNHTSGYYLMEGNQENGSSWSVMLLAPLSGKDGVEGEWGLIVVDHSDEQTLSLSLNLAADGMAKLTVQSWNSYAQDSQGTWTQASEGNQTIATLDLGQDGGCTVALSKR